MHNLSVIYNFTISESNTSQHKDREEESGKDIESNKSTKSIEMLFKFLLKPTKLLNRYKFVIQETVIIDYSLILLHFVNRQKIQIFVKISHPPISFPGINISDCCYLKKKIFIGK